MTVAIIDAPVDGLIQPKGQITTVAASRRIGIVINPRSYGNRVNPLQLEAVLSRYPEIRCASPADPDALLTTLRNFASDKVDLVVISGGDGTVRDVLSALAASDFSSPPELAILASGNTNLAGRVLGSSGHGERALETLLNAIANGQTRRRAFPVLQVSWIGEPVRPPVYGFLFGAAAFTEAKRIAAETVQRRGIHQGLAVGATLLTTAAKAILGRRGTLSDGTRMEVRIDDALPSDAHRFLILATTLDRFMLGLWPFWGHGSGLIRWLDIEAPAPWLAAALWAVLLRRPSAWMRRRGYRSGHAKSLRIRMDQSFILDGEAFSAGSEGILLSASHSVTVVTA
jgi:hypothetical protein